jgi:hypothetical protein
MCAFELAFADSDADGMPDDCEQNHIRKWNDNSDAAEDADGDGQSTLAEFLAGTDPQNPLSRCRIAIRWGHRRGSALDT